MTTPANPTVPEGAQKAVNVGAVGTSATAMLACGACCALPILFPALALGASGAVLAWLAGSLAWLRITAALAVIAGWGLAVWQRRALGRPIRRSTWALLTVATVLTGVAFIWETIEPGLMAALR